MLCRNIAYLVSTTTGAEAYVTCVRHILVEKTDLEHKI